MASSITRPIFSFSLHQSKPSKPHLPLPRPLSFPLHKPHHPLTISISPLHSVDVSQDDKPLEQQEDSSQDQPDTQQEEPGIDPRRLEEKFVVLNTGIYECRSCGYNYNESVGDPLYPIPPGFQFEKLPDDWRCPTCGAAQSFFVSKSMEIAGFEQNQQFGLGGNTLTSGQKALLIYGSLLFAFALFLSGYFLQ